MRCTEAKQGLGSKGLGREAGAHAPGVDYGRAGIVWPGPGMAVSDSAASCLGRRQHCPGSWAPQHSFEPQQLGVCFSTSPQQLHKPLNIRLYDPLSAAERRLVKDHISSATGTPYILRCLPG